MGCYFKEEAGSYILGNEYIERTWLRSSKGIFTGSLKNKLSGREWAAGEPLPAEVYYEGLTGSVRGDKAAYDLELVGVSENRVDDPIFTVPYTEAVFHMTDKVHGVELKRHAVLYEGAAAIRTFVEVKSYNLPMGYFYLQNRLNILDSYMFQLDVDKLASYEFYTRTDLTNHLVDERKSPQGFDRGNILMYTPQDGEGLFILKESPCFSDQRPECEGNFNICGQGVQVLGWGIRPEEVIPDVFLTTYSSVIGVFSGGDEYGFLALKRYQCERAPLRPDRDYMVMANPWGDRQCAEHMGEGFVLRELDGCVNIGATHYQLDDGWQKGEGLIRLVNNEAVDKHYWDIDMEKFPNGFENIRKKASQCGVELALWFAPDSNRLFRNYREQADFLYSMYINYGIRKFKIDAVKLRNKEAEDNLERLLRELRERSAGDITFNLDVTADARSGYFMFQEYGNIFFENRYTDWHNYYPYLTLKNLWELCRFVRPQKLQIEFLNIDRNQDKYQADDMLAPHRLCYEYVFAAAMFANPLCWFEPSALGPEAVKHYKAMIQLHKKYRDEIFSGHIFPIGQKPDGHSWTGFQSHRPETGSGYVIFYRELNENANCRFKLFFTESRQIKLTSLTDETPVMSAEAGEEPEIHLDAPNSFRIYEYKLI